MVDGHARTMRSSSSTSVTESVPRVAECCAAKSTPHAAFIVR
jgi:hypothetical protein